MIKLSRRPLGTRKKDLTDPTSEYIDNEPEDFKMGSVIINKQRTGREKSIGQAIAERSLRVEYRDREPKIQCPYCGRMFVGKKRAYTEQECPECVTRRINELEEKLLAATAPPPSIPPTPIKKMKTRMEILLDTEIKPMPKKKKPPPKKQKRSRLSSLYR